MYYTKKLNKYLYMKKYKFLRISKTKKLRYIHNYCSKKLYVIFLPGFMSDIEGKKPQSFLRFALKPTSSISQIQKSINSKGKVKNLQVKGRHDPCLCPRAVPIAEAMVNLVLLDCILENKLSTLKKIV